MIFRKPYIDPENDQYLGDVCAIDCSGDEDKTLQQFKEEADINVMLRRFGVTGQPPVGAPGEALYGDFSAIPDLQTALNTVREAEANFMRLPSDVRARFANNPVELVRFVQDDANYDEAVRLGLVPKPAAPVQGVKVEDLPE